VGELKLNKKGQAKYEGMVHQKLAERVGFLLPRCFTPPPKPATLTVIRSAHSSSPGSVRVGFESLRT